MLPGAFIQDKTFVRDPQDDARFPNCFVGVGALQLALGGGGASALQLSQRLEPGQECDFGGIPALGADGDRGGGAEFPQVKKQ